MPSNFSRNIRRNMATVKARRPRAMEARHSPHKFLPGHQQFWGKVPGLGKRTAFIRHCVAKLQTLMQMEGGAVLWTYHKMGLQGQKSPRLHARVCYQSLHPFALSTLASQQAHPTEQRMALCKQFLDYMASQDEAVLTYKASGMVLAVHNNASYLSKLKARSRAG